MSDAGRFATPPGSALGGFAGSLEDGGAQHAVKVLVFTDLVGSTKLVKTHGEERGAQISLQIDRRSRDAMARFEGLEIDRTDGYLILFDRPINAIAWALAHHRDLQALSDETNIELRSRVGIHLGEVVLVETPVEDVARGAKPIEVEGVAKHFTSRLMSVARGGQTLVTRGAFDLARKSTLEASDFDGELVWHNHGEYYFKESSQTVEVCEVGEVNRAPLEAPEGNDLVALDHGQDTIPGWRPSLGDTIPKRPNWVLSQKFGEGAFTEVWLSQHAKTRSQQVFKFCFRSDRLGRLKREVTVLRYLKKTLGTRPDVVGIVDWDFEQAPYFIECEYAPEGSLLEWIKKHGSLRKIPMEQRLELVITAAEALAAVHEVGVLHRNIKPNNILVRANSRGGYTACISDFGMGTVLNTEQVVEEEITIAGFGDTVIEEDVEPQRDDDGPYTAPERTEGKPATTQADIYSLGMILYQLAIGDMKRAMAPGWRRYVKDELLAEDIAAAMDLSVGQRLLNASELAQRLRTLEQRRQELEQKRATEARVAKRKRNTTRALIAILLLTLLTSLPYAFHRIGQLEEQLEAAGQNPQVDGDGR